MAHTPGPWTHEVQYVSAEHKQTTGDSIIRGHLGMYIGKVSDHNAPLIAAVLDLLAACKTALATLEAVQADSDGVGQMPWVEIQALQQAIDKAEGKQ